MNNGPTQVVITVFQALRTLVEQSCPSGSFVQHQTAHSCWYARVIATFEKLISYIYNAEHS